MKTLLGFALLVAVIWLVARSRRGSSGRVTREPLAASAFRADIETAVRCEHSPGFQNGELLKIASKSGKEHVPPSPCGGGVEAWSPRTQQFEVAGEWYRAEHLRTLFGRQRFDFQPCLCRTNPIRSTGELSLSSWMASMSDTWSG